MVYSLHLMLEPVVLDKLIPLPRITGAVMAERTDDASEGALVVNTILFKDNEDIPSVAGFDSEIGAISMKSACELDVNDTSRCSVASHGFLI
jgi:hypothetical protein